MPEPERGLGLGPELLPGLVLGLEEPEPEPFLILILVLILKMAPFVFPH